MAGSGHSDDAKFQDQHAIVIPAPEEQELHSDLTVPRWSLTHVLPMGSANQNDNQQALDIYMPKLEDQPADGLHLEFGEDLLENLSDQWTEISTHDNLKEDLAGPGQSEEAKVQDEHAIVIPSAEDHSSTNLQIPGWSLPNEVSIGAGTEEDDTRFGNQHSTITLPLPSFSHPDELSSSSDSEDDELENLGRSVQSKDSADDQQALDMPMPQLADQHADGHKLDFGEDFHENLEDQQTRISTYDRPNEDEVLDETLAGPKRSDDRHGMAIPSPEEQELHSSANLQISGWSLPNEVSMGAGTEEDDTRFGNQQSTKTLHLPRFSYPDELSSSSDSEDDELENLGRSVQSKDSADYQQALDIHMPQLEDQPADGHQLEFGEDLLENISDQWTGISTHESPHEDVALDETLAGPERSDDVNDQGSIVIPAPGTQEVDSVPPGPGLSLPNELQMSSANENDNQQALDIQMPHSEQQPSAGHHFDFVNMLLVNLGRMLQGIYYPDSQPNEAVLDQTLEGSAPSEIHKGGKEQEAPEGQDVPSTVNIPGIFQNSLQPWTAPSENTPGTLGSSITSGDFDGSKALDHHADVFQNGSSSLSQDRRSEDSEVEVLDQTSTDSERQENQSEGQPSSNGLKSVLKKWAERIGFFSFGALMGSQAINRSSSHNQTPASHQSDQAILMRSIILFPAIVLTGYSFGQWIRRDQPICNLACFLVWIFSAILFWCLGH